MSERKFGIFTAIIIILSGLAVFLVYQQLTNPALTSSVSNIAVSGTTLLLALVTYKSVIDAKIQAAKAQRALARPVLVPTNPLHTEDLANARERHLDIQNVGTGAALNIWGVLAPFSEAVVGLPKQMSMRFPFPLSKEDAKHMLFSDGGTMFKRGDAIDGVPIFIPEKLQPDEGFPDVHDRQYRVIARLILTYVDLFSQIHLAAFDFTTQDEWILVEFRQDISKGIRELDLEKTQPRKPRRKVSGG